MLSKRQLKILMEFCSSPGAVFFITVLFRQARSEYQNCES